MAGLAEKILERLQTCDKLHTLDLVQIFNEDHQKIIGAVKSLQALENVITNTTINCTLFRHFFLSLNL